MPPKTRAKNKEGELKKESASTRMDKMEAVLSELVTVDREKSGAIPPVLFQGDQRTNRLINWKRRKLEVITLYPVRPAGGL